MQSTCRPTVYTEGLYTAYTRDLCMPILKMTVGLISLSTPRHIMLIVVVIIYSLPHNKMVVRDIQT